jgi:hypothetical protein
VGIGTTVPSEKLELSNGGIQLNGSYGIGFNGETPFSSDVNGDRARIYYNDKFIDEFRDFLVIEKTDANSANPDGGIVFTNKGSDNVRNAALSIRGNGYVGIGTAAPSTELHVKGSTPQITMQPTADSQSAGRLVFQNTAGTDIGQIIYDTTLNSLRFNVGGPWSERLRIDSSGNVGIGTANPQAKLHVTGNIKYKAGTHSVQMTNTPGYLEYIIDGNPYGVTIWASSKRFKEDIKDLEISSEKIHALNPVSFKWIEERGGKEDFGLIAEEVAETIPALAAYDAEGKPFSVRYELLSVLLLKELKTQQTTNTKLMNHLSKLEKRIEALEKSR